MTRGTPRNILKIGQRFGKLTVLDMTSHREKNRSVLWSCQCDCGRIILTTSSRLIKQYIKSCGCSSKSMIQNARFISRIGELSGKLTVLEEMGKNPNDLLICSCKCGNRTTIKRFQFGKTLSCGCIRQEIIKIKRELGDT